MGSTVDNVFFIILVTILLGGFIVPMYFNYKNIQYRNEMCNYVAEHFKVKTTHTEKYGCLVQTNDGFKPLSEVLIIKND